MWIFLNDAYLSIVAQDDDPNLLRVRARVKGDIERVFPGVKTKCTSEADYRYRALIPRKLVAQVLADRLLQIDYPNFKNSVAEHDRHDAYLRVWNEMFCFQSKRARKPRRRKSRARRFEAAPYDYEPYGGDWPLRSY